MVAGEFSGDCMATSKKVLVIDDDARLIESIQDFLQPHGYGVHGIADGRHVVDTVRKLASAFCNGCGPPPAYRLSC